MQNISPEEYMHMYVTQVESEVRNMTHNYNHAAELEKRVRFLEKCIEQLYQEVFNIPASED